jgi:hypothetical protein
MLTYDSVAASRCIWKALANAQVTAQLALSNLASTTRQPTQKEEMLAGRQYFPFDEEVVLERERCSVACGTSVAALIPPIAYFQRGVHVSSATSCNPLSILYP